jgi:hypothetical protein
MRMGGEGMVVDREQAGRQTSKPEQAAAAAAAAAAVGSVSCFGAPRPPAENLEFPPGGRRRRAQSSRGDGRSASPGDAACFCPALSLVSTPSPHSNYHHAAHDGKDWKAPLLARPARAAGS